MAVRARRPSVFPSPMTLDERQQIVKKLGADAKGYLCAYLAGRFPLVFDQILREMGRTDLSPERIREG